MARLTSVEEQIRALEQSLHSDSDNSDEYISDDDLSESELDKKQFQENYVKEVEMDDQLVIEKDKFGNPVRIYSKTGTSESIPSLNRQYLPGTRCGHGIGINVPECDSGSSLMGKTQTLKAPMERNAKAVEKIKGRLAAQGKVYVERGASAGDAGGAQMGEEAGDRKRRKVAFAGANVEAGAGSGVDKKRPQTGAMSAGLSKTIHELLDNYVPASNFEPTAFFCRICKHTAANEEDFIAHKESELHLRLQQEERKRSECRLCRKQFTSPDQLRGHLNGNKHKEKLASTKRAQQQQKKFC